jgi:hypothetical protein
MFGTEISAGHAAFLQTATAIVQAIVSVSLLAWYVLTAHVERVRARRERSEDFESLVLLCRELGIEAKNKTEAHRRRASSIAEGTSDPAEATQAALASWKADMTVVYVCLNEVPHYEVRNPAFSTALTRLWMEVDARNVDPKGYERGDQLASFLDEKHERVCREIDAMAALLTVPKTAPELQSRLVGAAKRRGNMYSVSGTVQEHVERI